MSEDRTQETKDTRTFEDRVFARFDSVDHRFDRLDLSLDRICSRLDNVLLLDDELRHQWEVMHAPKPGVES